MAERYAPGNFRRNVMQTYSSRREQTTTMWWRVLLLCGERKHRHISTREAEAISNYYNCISDICKDEKYYTKVHWSFWNPGEGLSHVLHKKTERKKKAFKKWKNLFSLYGEAFLKEKIDFLKRYLDRR